MPVNAPWWRRRTAISPKRFWSGSVSPAANWRTASGLPTRKGTQPAGFRRPGPRVWHGAPKRPSESLPPSRPYMTENREREHHDSSSIAVSGIVLINGAEKVDPSQGEHSHSRACALLGWPGTEKRNAESTGSLQGRVGPVPAWTRTDIQLGRPDHLFPGRSLRRATSRPCKGPCDAALAAVFQSRNWIACTRSPPDSIEISGEPLRPKRQLELIENFAGAGVGLEPGVRNVRIFLCIPEPPLPVGLHPGFRFSGFERRSGRVSIFGRLVQPRPCSGDPTESPSCLFLVFAKIRLQRIQPFQQAFSVVQFRQLSP